MCTSTMRAGRAGMTFMGCKPRSAHLGCAEVWQVWVQEVGKPLNHRRPCCCLQALSNWTHQLSAAGRKHSMAVVQQNRKQQAPGDGRARRREEATVQH